MARQAKPNTERLKAIAARKAGVPLEIWNDSEERFTEKHKQFSTFYAANNAAHVEAVGFRNLETKEVEAWIIPHVVFPWGCRITTASRKKSKDCEKPEERWIILQFAPTKGFCEWLNKCGHLFGCKKLFTISCEQFESDWRNWAGEQTEEEDEENNKLNRGHYFEKLVADFFGDCYVLNNTPYYLAGDVTTKKGIEIQCKFTGATVISEKQINK